MNKFFNVLLATGLILNFTGCGSADSASQKKDPGTVETFSLDKIGGVAFVSYDPESKSWSDALIWENMSDGDETPLQYSGATQRCETDPVTITDRHPVSSFPRLLEILSRAKIKSSSLISMKEGDPLPGVTALLLKYKDGTVKQLPLGDGQENTLQELTSFLKRTLKPFLKWRQDPGNPDFQRCY